MSTNDSEETTGLSTSSQPRVIGTWGGLAIVIGSMLGIGIFITPPQVATHLPSVGMYLGAWIFGGIIAFCGAVAYAELGTRFPRAGGDYVFLREAFGKSLSFGAGWLLFVGVFTGSVATMAVPLAEFQLPVLLGPAVEIDPHRVLWSLGFLELTVARVFAVVIIAALTVLNILGTRLSTNAQVALTGIPMALLAVAAVVIFWTMEPATMQAPITSEESMPISFGRAVLAIYFAYAGWNAIAYVGGEMKNPAQTVPRSLLGGTAAITVLYLLLATGFVYVLGIEGIQDVMEAGTATADAIAGDWATWMITALIAVALIGSLNATVLAGGRVGWAMARSGAMASSVGQLNDRFRTPARALLLQGALAVVLVMTGTFEMLLELTSIAMFVMGALTVAALFVIRGRDGDDAPYQATGYPWVPGTFIVISAVIVAASLYRAGFGVDGGSAESLYPLAGLGLFVAMSMGHFLIHRKSKAHSRD